MTKLKRTYRVREFVAELGRHGVDHSEGVIRSSIREGRIPARDLNAGTGRRPRYRIPSRALKPFLAQKPLPGMANARRQRKPKPGPSRKSGQS